MKWLAHVTYVLGKAVHLVYLAGLIQKRFKLSINIKALKILSDSKI